MPNLLSGCPIPSKRKNRMSQKAPLSLRFARIFRLLAWLFKTARALRRLDNASMEERYEAMRRMSQGCLDVLDVRLDVQDSGAEQRAQNGLLLAANHVSWLDIFAITALYPSSFIAMQELRRWPFIGRMITNAGTVYIDRSSRKDIGIINAAISRVLDAGGRVCFFPEARTTLGNGILPLKAALFQAALDSRAPVQPVVLRYYDSGVRTEAVSFANANLFQSLWRVVSIPQIVVKVDILAQIRPDMLPENDRFVMKDRVEQEIAACVLADSPNPERVLPPQ